MERQDAAERNEAEGKFGEGQRLYGLGLIRACLREASETVIAPQLLVMNFGAATPPPFVRRSVASALSNLDCVGELVNRSTGLTNVFAQNTFVFIHIS